MRNRIDTFKSFNEKSISESSNYRIYQWIKNYDCVIITAFRSDIPRNINIKRNTELKSILREEGYNITELKGIYIENYKMPGAKEVLENSFLVVNKDNKIGFKSLMSSLGEKYNQDSILIINKGGRAFLYGTNKSGHPGLYQAVDTGELKIKEEGEFYSKKSGGIKFRFTKNDLPPDFDPKFTKI